MKNLDRYFFEYLLLAIVMALSIAGFWNLYYGADSRPNLHHHLHVATNFAWLFMLWFQLRLVGKGNYAEHRKVGQLVLILAPLLVASTALLSVHSAHRGLVSGGGDFLIVQNVMVTLELGLIVLLAFVLRKRRKLHGAFMLSTAILFMGIALFFTLIGFVPQFRIEGPETFHRFASAGIFSQSVCVAVGLLFFIKDLRNGWPFLLVGSFFFLNEFIKSLLAGQDMIEPLTEVVGSMSQPLTFIASFAVVFALLAATGIRSARRVDGAPRGILGAKG